jgi:hypothetical protein
VQEPNFNLQSILSGQSISELDEPGTDVLFKLKSVCTGGDVINQ